MPGNPDGSPPSLIEDPFNKIHKGSKGLWNEMEPFQPEPTPNKLPTSGTQPTGDPEKDLKNIANGGNNESE